jgi:hypothetical protein
MKTKSGWFWAGAIVLTALMGASFCARAQKVEASVTGTIASDTGSDAAKGRRALMLTVGDGGTGAYKAVLTGEESLKTHTIFRPRDLSPFGGSNLLPIVAWGNGSCANSATEFRNLLSEIASHGYLIVAIGPPASSIDLAAAQGSTTTSQLFDGIDWAVKENSRAESVYFGKIDTKKIAVMGMSCGGLQALEASADPRITTTIIWNSGAFIHPPTFTPPPGTAGGPPQGFSMPAVSKDDLKKIHSPILYVTGTKGIELENAKDDYSRINQVPIMIAIRDGAQHYEGTIYRAPNAGEYGRYGSAWLDWQLKGDKQAAELFSGADCGICKDPKWSVEKKNIP